MRDFYQLTAATTLDKNWKISKTLYHVAPLLKIAAIGVFVYSFSLTGALRYGIMATALAVFLISVLLNFVRLKISFEYRYTCDRDCLTVEKVYYRLKPEKLAVFPRNASFYRGNDGVPLYFEDNPMEYFLSCEKDGKKYSVSVDTYMFAMLTESEK